MFFAKAQVSIHGAQFFTSFPFGSSGTSPGLGMVSRKSESSTWQLCEAKTPDFRILQKSSISFMKGGIFFAVLLLMPMKSASRAGILVLGAHMREITRLTLPSKISATPYSTTPIFLEPSKSIINIGAFKFFILLESIYSANITDMDTESFKIFINELADISGDYISKNFGSKLNVDLKKDSSPVTEVDRNTELMLRDAIHKKFPTHGIIGEEFGNENEDAEFVWVLDPIDGTKSFITGVPLFGTLIGLMRAGEPFVGLIDQPILKERVVGDRKTCLFNGKPVKTANKTDLSGITLLTSDSRHCVAHHNPEGWRALEKAAAISRTWGDCYGYMLLCRGYAHVMCDAILEVWDFTALLPALEGAGAAFSDWRGKGDIGNKHGLVASCTQELHDKVIKLLDTEV